MVGQMVAHYRIVDKIGEGGMGVVYRAKDMHLDRFVALKVLPPGKITDPERIHRFVQEAKAASALNHPNIVTIYDIDTVDGVTFIAMEYVQGRTLGRWIRTHPSLSDILKYGAQIASALSASHAKGIVHRDLKPSNIMISDAGLVKVLDFGLAKLTEVVAPGEQGLTKTLPLDGPPTADGLIVGTASYMSPEQAEGKMVDYRTDIFALGLILYEMVSGRRAFQGDTVVATLAAILTAEPEPLQQIAPTTPPDLLRIVNRCLRKDRGKRFQHMDDINVALEELREESDSGKLAAVASAPSKSPARGRWMAAGVLLVTAVAVSIPFWSSRWRPQENRNEGPVLTRLTSDTGLTLEPAFWAQGNLLAYASDRSGGGLDIYVQQLGGGEPHRLTSNEADDHEPDFSPDGTKIVFRSERDGGGLYVVPTLGGAERKIADGGRYPKFSPDGKWIAHWNGEPATQREALGRLLIMPSNGGPSKQIAAGASPGIWSPDSRHLLYAARTVDFTWFFTETTGSLDWFTVSVDGATTARTDASDAFREQKFESYLPRAWTNEGITFQAAGRETTNIWRVSISRDLKITGPCRRLTFGTGLDTQPVVAANRIIFAEIAENADIWAIPIDTNEG